MLTPLNTDPGPNLASILSRIGLPSGAISQPVSGAGLGLPSLGAPGPATAPIGMFGAKPTYLRDRPEGLPSASSVPAQLSAQAPNLPAADVPAYHPGFFQHGGLGGKILHGLGEFALNYSASQGDPRALAVLQHRYRMQEQADDEAQALRKLVLQRQLAAANPEPTAIQRTYEWLRTQHPDLAEQYLQTQTTAPPIVQSNGDGTSTVYPAGSIPRMAPAGASPSGPPANAIAYLRQNPSLAAQFDAKYGAGSSARVLNSGGATAAPSRTFP